MKTNYVPAIIMLLAGLVDSVISIYYKLDLYSFTKRLLLVLVIFYILGCVVKIILNINFPLPDTDASSKTAEEMKGTSSDNTDETDDVENIDTENQNEENDIKDNNTNENDAEE